MSIGGEPQTQVDVWILSQSNWKAEAKALMSAKKRFGLGAWDFNTHHRDCVALAEDFNYHYQWNPAQGRAYFTPRLQDDRPTGFTQFFRKAKPGS